MTKNKMSIQTFFICSCWIGYFYKILDSVLIMFLSK